MYTEAVKKVESLRYTAFILKGRQRVLGGDKNITLLKYTYKNRYPDVCGIHILWKEIKKKF